MWELIPLALLSAVYPTLVAVVVVALASPNPAREMAFFLVGGMIASVTVGVVIVLSLQGTSFVSGSNPPADPILYFGAGAFALLLAFIVHRRPPPHHEGSGRVTRLLSKSQRASVAFLAGLLLNIAPGAWYLVALKDMATTDWSTAHVVAAVIAFCIVQYALIELPLIGFVFWPERATDSSRRFSAWLGDNSKSVGVVILLIAGCYMILRGIISAT
jgi:hypothetical protein